MNYIESESEPTSKSSSGGAILFFLVVIGLALVAGGHGKAVSSTASSSAYVSLARQDAINQGIDPNHFVNQIQAESSFNPNATSANGAEGIAQFMPATAASLGIDPYNPAQALMSAAKLDRANIQAYGDEAKGYAAYNCGNGCVDRAMNKSYTNWRNYIPVATQNYVNAILG